jgi:hypothetical protein
VYGDGYCGGQGTAKSMKWQQHKLVKSVSKSAGLVAIE